MPTTISGTDGVDNVRNGTVTPSDLSTGAPTWNASGNVGIGTSSPVAKLDVAGSGDMVNSIIRSTDTSSSRLTLSTSSRAWTLTNYGSQFSPNNSFNIADETGAAVRLTIDTAGAIYTRGNPIVQCPTTCRTWVNFNGFDIYNSANALNASTIVATAGSNVGTWNASGAFTASSVGVIYYIPTIGGVTGATLGGLDVRNVGFQVTGFVSSSQLTIRFLAGNATSSQTITGNGSSTGFQISSSGIRSSYNVSNITKLATGRYQINFITPMNDANYSISALAAVDGTWGVSGSYKVVGSEQVSTTTTTSCVIGCYQPASAVMADTAILTVQFFGN